MSPERRYCFLKRILSPLELRHQKVILLVAAAIAETGAVRSYDVALRLCQWTGVAVPSALNRLRRLVRNERVETESLSEVLLRSIGHSQREFLTVSIDWTEWRHGLRALVAAAVVGKRAVPVFARAYSQRIWRGSQNQRENDFVRQLAKVARDAKTTLVILCDRGFRRASWLHLMNRLDQSFVVRLMDDVTFHGPSGQSRVLSSIAVPPKQRLDLGTGTLTHDRKAQVRVVAYRARRDLPVWWLATNLDVPPAQIVALYDRRMTVEEQFRDLKGHRFGLRMRWLNHHCPQRLARLMMLAALALLTLLVAGLKALGHHDSLQLSCRKKGPRYSLIQVGRAALAASLKLLWPLRISDLAQIPPPAFRLPHTLAPGGK